MKIGILGTGMVGQAIGTGLVKKGHEVKMGSRDANNAKAKAWVGTAGTKASQGTFADAAKFGEIVFNCTGGGVSLEALKQAGEQNLAGKVLVDVANPLDFSKGMPPTLSVCNTSSLGEQIQAAFPNARVVKTLNTLNAQLMMDPSLMPGPHEIFVSGNDAAAKAQITKLLGEVGWKEIIDLGDITTARGTEMLLPIWIRLMGTFGTPMFNFHLARKA